MTSRTGALVALGALLLLPLRSDVALGQSWSVEAQMGRLDFQADPSGGSASSSLSLGLRYARPSGSFRISGGVPLAEQDPLWGAADASWRLALTPRPVRLGLDLVGQGFVQRYAVATEQIPGGILDRPPRLGEEVLHGLGVVGQATPFIALGHGIAELQARAGVSQYYSALGDQARTRRVPMADVQLTVSPAHAVALGTELRRYEPAEGASTFAGVTAHLLHARGNVWGSIGRWLTDSVSTIPWSAGAALRVSGRTELSLHARQDAFDPLFASSPRRSWGVGVSVAVARPPAPPAPVPHAYSGGRATILLPVRESTGQPLIAGDFNDWTPTPMVRDGGSWSYSVPVEPGVYHYAFVTIDGEWFVPESVPGRREDGMGGYVALLVVD